MPRIACRVVCGRLDVMATLSPTSAFVSVDLPVLGRPTMQAKPLRNPAGVAMAGIVPHVNAMGFTAAAAAYRDCSDWHAGLLDYLRGNRDCVARAIDAMPLLSLAPVEATYLAWIDVRSSDLKDPVKFFEDAGVGLQDGVEFDGRGFVRLNFGCARALLDKALERMASAMEQYVS